MAPRAPSDGTKTVVSNRRATHEYAITERFEAGIVLSGAEVKSLRGGKGSLAEAYARLRDGEVWLEGCHIPPYEQQMDKRTYDPVRPRKLLLHRGEIDRLAGTMAQRGSVLIPLRIFLAHGLVKVELGLGKGKRLHEKRQSIAERDARREMDREARRRR